ncbi:two-component system sensor histidine kinase YesM [Anaerotaenia torta]|uniref:sensor histidine kinase n=1 Tax=Anaerotaenia torta TaxID=433293 RepID=UPI003D1C6CE7
MIKQIKRMGLRKQLVVIFAACITIVLSTQLFYNISIFRKKTDENTANCYSTIMQTNSMLTQVSDRISSVGKSVSGNQYVQELLNLNNDSSKENLNRRKELIDILSNYMGSIINANEMLNDIALIDNNERIIATTAQFNYISYKKLTMEYDINNLKSSIFTSWLYFVPVQVGNNGFAYIAPVYYTTGEFEVESARLGTCIIWSKPTPLVDIVKSTAATEGATVLVADANGYVMALNSSYSISEISEEIDAMLQNHKSSEDQEEIQKMKFMGRESFVLMKEHTDTGWKSVNIVPTEEVYKETFETLHFGIGVVLVSIVILTGFGVYMVSSITRPLDQITHALDSIGSGNRKYRVNVSEKNEFGIISDRINAMLDNINHMNHRIFDMQSKLYEKELMQKESEMLTLQSQINPHFLYNTLECIRAIAVIHNIREIPVITTSMSKIFRYSIKGGMVTTIKTELECLEDYYKIIAIRYNERLILTVDVDNRLYPYSMLKMSLQPIIENSVYHGLEATERKVNVTVRGRMEGEYAVFFIEDDGAGIPPDKLQAINASLDRDASEDITEVSRSKSSIGLTNINSRIKLHYGRECGLKLESPEGGGTLVTIRIRLLLEI